MGFILQNATLSPPFTVLFISVHQSDLFTRSPKHSTTVLKAPEICTKYFRSRGIKSDLAWEGSEMLPGKRDSVLLRDMKK